MASPDDLPDLAERIRHADLRHFYRRWRQALIDGGSLPSLDTFGPGDLAPCSFVVDVDRTGFRFSAIGARLMEWLDGPLQDMRVTDDAPEAAGSLKAAYRNCVSRQVPIYDYLRCGFGDAAPFTFERIVVPLFNHDYRVAHVAGAVHIENVAAPVRAS